MAAVWAEVRQAFIKPANRLLVFLFGGFKALWSFPGRKALKGFFIFSVIYQHCLFILLDYLASFSEIIKSEGKSLD
jgi:hypothetical protein